jgi:hypothetical protein
MFFSSFFKTNYRNCIGNRNNGPSKKCCIVVPNGDLEGVLWVMDTELRS